MKRIAIGSAAVAAAFFLAAIPAAAQHGRGPGMSGMHATHGNAGEMTTPAGPKTPDQLLTQNHQLSTKLQSLLPSGTNLQTAASGYKNLGQFVAAVHVSHNLGIPFSSLKCKELSSSFCTPTSTAKGESLGRAIQQLKPSANATIEARKANREAREDLRASHS